MKHHKKPACKEKPQNMHFFFNSLALSLHFQSLKEISLKQLKRKIPSHLESKQIKFNNTGFLSLLK